MSIRLHSRFFVVQGVEADLGSYMTQLFRTHDITMLEAAGILNELQASYLKYALRAERHPDSNKRADEE